MNNSILHGYLEKSLEGDIFRVWCEKDLATSPMHSKRGSNRDDHHPFAMLKQELQELATMFQSLNNKKRVQVALHSLILPSNACTPFRSLDRNDDDQCFDAANSGRVYPKRQKRQANTHGDKEGISAKEIGPSIASYRPWRVWAFSFLADEFIFFLKDLRKILKDSYKIGASLQYWLDVAEVGFKIVLSGGYVPEIREFMDSDGTVFSASWQAWWARLPPGLLESVAGLMPNSCLAGQEELETSLQDPRMLQERKETTLDAFFSAIINGCVHSAFARKGFVETLERMPLSDATFRMGFAMERYAFREKNSLKKYTDWLQELVWGRGACFEILNQDSDGGAGQAQVFHDVVTTFARWTWQPAAIIDARPWLPCFTIGQPKGAGASAHGGIHAGPAESRDDLGDTWHVSLDIIRNDGTGETLPASVAWVKSCNPVFADQGFSFDLRHLILETLQKASHIYEPFHEFLNQAIPEAIQLSPAQVHDVATRLKPAFEDAGLKIAGVDWIGQEPDMGLVIKIAGSAFTGNGGFELQNLLKFDWQVAIGGETISLAVFKSLVKKNAPLVKFREKWMEIPSTMRTKAFDFLKRDIGHDKMSLGRALRLSLGRERVSSGFQVVRLEGEGSAKEFLDQLTSNIALEPVSPPKALCGTLRPYQQRGLDWLAFITRHGLGGCLADDMGLGKTIQAIALLLHDKERRVRVASSPVHGAGSPPNDQSPHDAMPDLIVCPVSVIGNWLKELGKFGPILKVSVHHGSRRMKGDAFLTQARENDIIVTTYSMVHRDEDAFVPILWNHVILDEAQNIKNDQTKQSRSIKALQALHKVALTGTPVENRLAELWSIMDFLNPDYLGSMGDFHAAFELPASRKDETSAEALNTLKRIIRPFVLRRVKSDRALVPELPDKIVVPEYCNLTKEQASIYQVLVNEMLSKVDGASSMERKGLILATLVKLKQVCDHPEVFLKNNGRIPDRSLKLMRLEELVESVLGINEKCIIFTQFVDMGEIIATHLRARFSREVLYMHGSVPAIERDRMVQSFQDPKPDSPPIFVLTLKTGGNGLNLTAANNVFHYDRWWNPAVENQATDRTHRIGQERKVTVYKFICIGTIEEHINKMIEEKEALAANVIDHGDKWITEMSTGELKRVFALRRDIVQEVA